MHKTIEIRNTRNGVTYYARDKYEFEVINDSFLNNVEYKEYWYYEVREKIKSFTIKSVAEKVSCLGPIHEISDIYMGLVRILELSRQEDTFIIKLIEG